MTEKAYILGNGPSRPNSTEWLNELEGDTYGCNAIYRIKCNLQVRQPESYIVEGFHSDLSFDMEKDMAAKWTTSILYINTNNGYTEFEDGTKVESVANRVVTFPADLMHRGATQTDEQTRILINFNYLKKKNHDQESIYSRKRPVTPE